MEVTAINLVLYLVSSAPTLLGNQFLKINFLELSHARSNEMNYFAVLGRYCKIAFQKSFYQFTLPPAVFS